MSLRTLLRRLAVAAIPSMRHLDMPKRLAHMKALGFEPRTIVDVGAAKGNWARMAAQIWPGAQIFGVEPNLSNVPMLELTQKELPNFAFRRGFLGSKPDKVRYRNASDQTSLLDIANSHGTAEADVFTLDNLIAEGATPRPQLLKLDVQGFELEVLNGALRTMETCEAILLEVSFAPLFPGTPLLHDAVEFMTRHSFLAYDVMGIYRLPQNDALGQLDFMFLRSDHPLRDNP